MPLRLSGSTGVSGIDGTAQAPAVQGTNPNAGIYYSGNNVIVSTSGNTALRVGPSGNVAISNSFSISGQFVTPYSGMMKNRIINGDFKIDQRFNGAANNNIAGIQYVVDRWINEASGAAKLRFQQNNTNGPGSSATQNATGFPNYFGANVVSSNTVSASDYWIVEHHIEGFNITDLGWGTANASPVTLSFWVYTSVPGTHGGQVTNSNSSRSYPFTYTVSSANTWEYETITIPGDTTGSWWSNNEIGISVYLDLGVGTTYTASAVNNAWVAGVTGNRWPTGTVKVVSNANGSFYLTGVQLEKGSQATPFEFRHYTTELQLCQRYYQTWGGTGTYEHLAVGYTTSTISGEFCLPYLVTMRAAPSLSISSPSHWNVSDSTAAVNLSSVTIDQTGLNSTRIMPVFSGLTANRPGVIRASATLAARFNLSAELYIKN